MNKIKVSIVILTYNGIQDYLKETVKAILKQDCQFNYEIIAIDSESTDKTVEFLKQNSAIKLKQIKKADFSHGKTRRLGAEMAEGELVVFLTQDATPANNKWLSELTKGFEDSRVVGVCGRVLPRKEACLLKKIEVDNDLSGRTEKIIAEIKNQAEFNKLDFYEKRINYYFFNDVSSCVRKDYYLEKPPIKVAFAEDVEFAKTALADGKKIIFEPKSTVYHSHDYTLLKTYKRNFVDSEYHRKYLKIKNVPTISNVYHNVVSQIRRDAREIKKYEASNIDKIKALMYSPLIHFAEQLGQYRGNKE